MADRASTTDRILAAAERRMREGGYHGVSFREVAADVGIKSASVHHHFPTKEALGAAVTRAYAERHMSGLGDPEDAARTPAELLTLYVDLFRQDLVADRRMCLCGVLAGERTSLPPRVNAEVRDFFERNRRWLERVLVRATPGTAGREVREKALLVTATLEGALLVAHCLGERHVFEGVARQLSAAISLPPAPAG